VAAYYIGPRLGLAQQHDRIASGNSKNCLMGLFMLWWAFLAFNAGSTFGISGTRWMYAGKATVTTITSSFGGGVAGIMGCYIFFGGKMKVPYIVNSVFASLVSITGVNFINILLSPFSYVNALCSFSLITVWLSNFLTNEYRRNSCS